MQLWIVIVRKTLQNMMLCSRRWFIVLSLCTPLDILLGTTSAVASEDFRRRGADRASQNKHIRLEIDSRGETHDHEAYGDGKANEVKKTAS